MTLDVAGGTGFASSVWFHDTFLGSFIGSGRYSSYQKTYTIPPQAVRPGQHVVLTVVIDMMGQDEESPGSDAIKKPRGILNFAVAGHSKKDALGA